jgi:archaemetzincin
MSMDESISPSVPFLSPVFRLTALLIFAFPNTPHSILNRLPDALRNGLPRNLAEVSVDPVEFSLPADAYVPARRQYSTDPFLDIVGHRVPPGKHGLGLVNLDLFVPSLNFIFGLAQHGGNALVALPRLSPVFYGLPENEELYFERVAKEALHEVGHVFGFSHCRQRCVMRFSNCLDDTDRKPSTFCPNCLKQLH